MAHIDDINYPEVVADPQLEEDKVLFTGFDLLLMLSMQKAGIFTDEDGNTTFVVSQNLEEVMKRQGLDMSKGTIQKALVVLAKTASELKFKSPEEEVLDD